MQGQLTSDCLTLSETQASPTALCNAKGRIISTGLIEKTKEGFVLSIPQSMTESIQAHLQKYILFSKVNQSISADTIWIEVGGEGIQDALTNFLNTPISTKPYTKTVAKAFHLIALPGEIPRWMIRTTNADSMISLWQAVCSIANPIGYPEANHIALKSHVVSIDSKLTNLFLPQMIDYDTIGGMSLKKGCYAGQEVLARTSHRGSVKRHLYQGVCKESAGLSKGMPILVSDTKVTVGTLVDHSQREGYHDILAVLSTPSLTDYCQLTVNNFPILKLSRAKPSLN